jgi:hypothetical protein
MATCEVCGNDYDKAFTVTRAGKGHMFDSFECAHCGCRVVGHGSEHAGRVYCCAHCAKHAGVPGLKDRA